MSRKSVTNLLKRLKTVFDKYEVCYWLDAGTLLKAYRDSDIIPSSDLDFGTWQTEIDKVLLVCDELKKDGFRIKHQGFMPFVEDNIKIYIPAKYSVSCFDSFDIDLYGELNGEAFRRNIQRPIKKSGKFIVKIYQELNNSDRVAVRLSGRIVHGLLKKIPCKLRAALSEIIFIVYTELYMSAWHVIPSSYFMKLTKMKLYGIDFKIPYDTKSYLQYRYGEAWKVPRSNWRHSDGKMIRFRRFNRIRGSNRIYRKVSSERFVEIAPRKVKDTFNFTEREIKKIKSLDSHAYES